MNNIALFLSIYSSVLATTVFIWRIFEFYIDRVGKFNIRVENVTIFPVYSNMRLGDEYSEMVKLSVTNVSKNARHVKEPSIETNKSMDGGKIFSLIIRNEIGNFPKKLEPGEQFEYSVEKNELSRHFKTKGVTRIRFVLQDTHLKIVKSKWIKI